MAVPGAADGTGRGARPAFAGDDEVHASRSTANDGEEAAPLFAEDLAPGMTHQLTAYLVSRDEIVEFASRWDPMPFHIDEDAGVGGAFGGVIGSGIHTLAIFQRLAVQRVYSRWAVIAGRTLREVQFTAPLRPGAQVGGSLEVVSISHSWPDRSLVTVRGALHADEGDALLSLHVDLYVARRSART